MATGRQTRSTPQEGGHVHSFIQPIAERKKPYFIAVLGAPGSGKTTQCEFLSSTYQGEHIRLDDALRSHAERTESDYYPIVCQRILDKLVVPEDITLSLLEAYIDEFIDMGVKLFFLDGFPWSPEQMLCLSTLGIHTGLIIQLDCCRDEPRRRLLARGRKDDKDDLINGRDDVFEKFTVPLIDIYEGRQALWSVNGDEPAHIVSNQLVDFVSTFAQRRIISHAE